MKLLSLIMTSLFLLNASAHATPPDVDCDGGLFQIIRGGGFNGDIFIWKFSGHLLEHLQGNRILSPMTRAIVTPESSYRLSLEPGCASIFTGPSWMNDTKLTTALWNGNVSYLFRLTRDPNSSGYFLRAFFNTNPAVHQAAEYYFHSCKFGPHFSVPGGI